MRFSTLILPAVLALAPIGVVSAQNFSPATTPNADATPFWDVVSDDDGTGCNIGYVLSGAVTSTSPSTTCVNNQLSAGYTAPYAASMAGAWFAHKSGDVNNTVSFGFIGGFGTTLTYFGGIAGAAPLKSLFLRDLGTGSILWEFSSVAGINKGTSYTFGSNAMFDIGIATYSPSSATPNYFSWTSDARSQFAMFGNGAYGAQWADCGTSGCWVGAEDIAMAASDYDYNDGILQITNATAVVPEPSTYALMAAGLAGLGVMSRRRRKA